MLYEEITVTFTDAKTAITALRASADPAAAKVADQMTAAMTVNAGVDAERFCAAYDLAKKVGYSLAEHGGQYLLVDEAGFVDPALA